MRSYKWILAVSSGLQLDIWDTSKCRLWPRFCPYQGNTALFFNQYLFLLHVNWLRTHSQKKPSAKTKTQQVEIRLKNTSFCSFKIIISVNLRIGQATTSTPMLADRVERTCQNWRFYQVFTALLCSCHGNPNSHCKPQFLSALQTCPGATSFH